MLRRGYARNVASRETGKESYVPPAKIKYTRARESGTNFTSQMGYAQYVGLTISLNMNPLALSARQSVRSVPKKLGNAIGSIKMR